MSQYALSGSGLTSLLEVLCFIYTSFGCVRSSKAGWLFQHNGDFFWNYGRFQNHLDPPNAQPTP